MNGKELYPNDTTDYTPDAFSLPEDNDPSLLADRQYAHIPSMRKVLALCFFLPALLMTLIYFCTQVWPAGDNAVLVLDLNAQYVYYFEKLRNVIVSGDSLLYSFERALGGEFLGIFAYYLSSPLSVLVALLPKAWMTEAIFLLLVVKTGLCGFSFAYYLMKTRQARPVWMVAFSLLYALSSYVVVMQHNVMWIDNVILFPFILLGMDALIREGRFRLYVGSLALAILSNFYIGYMTCFFLAVYFFIRYATLTPDERNPHMVRHAFWKTLLRMLFFSLLAVMIAAMLILPVYYSLSFGKLEFSEPKYEAKQLFDWLEMLTKAFFGSYDSVRPTGMPFLFCGTLMPLLLPLYFLCPKITLRKKIGSLITLAFFFLSFNFSILDIIWHGFQRPNWLNARFAFMFVFFAVLCTYDAFRYLRETGIRKIGVTAMVSVVLLLVMQAMGYKNVDDFLTVWAGIFFLAAYAVCVPFALRKSGQDTVSLYTNRELLLVMLIVFETVLNGVAMTYSLDADVSFTTRRSYRNFVDKYSAAAEMIQSIDAEKYGADDFYRVEKTSHRKKNDNFAIDINGLSNSTSTLNAKTIAFLHNIGLSARSHWSMYYGGTPVSDAIFDIRYLIVDHMTNDYVPDYVETLYSHIADSSLSGSENDALAIYESPFSLGIAFGTNSAIRDYAEYDAEDEKKREEAGNATIASRYADAVEYHTPFEMMNHMLSAMLGEEIEVFTPVDARETSTPGLDPTFTTGHRGYKTDGSGLTAKIVYSLDITESLPLYVYFPSDYPRDATMKLDKGNVGKFFTDDSFCVQELGILDGGEHEFALYLEEEEIYLASGCDYFWYFHEDTFRDAMARLSAGSMTAKCKRDDRIDGTITLSEGMDTVFTSIPYDAGWIVTVDGERVETFCIADALLGFASTPGEHTVVLQYRPNCVKYGVILSAVGIAAYAGLSFWDWRRRDYAG